MPIPDPSRPRPATRNIAWIVVGSLLAAVLLSVVLVMIVVAGARENVISAAVILAFAAGAGLLAVLSTRRSDQPQRWARIAAGWLTLAGTALLIWPGVVSTTAIAWVAPVLLLALVVWMTRRVRRELNSRIRPWLMYPVFAVIACAAVAGGYETVQELLDRAAHPMHGQLVDVGGRRIYLSCVGSGTPVVVLVQGAGEASLIWGWIAPDVARDTRVCVYDRAGRGWSDAAPVEQDGMAIATDLETLLMSAHETAPYVLVGHSFGGLYVQSFAARYQSHTAGVVLLDATDPLMFTKVPPYPRFYEVFRRVSALFPSLARFGVGRIAYGSSYDGLPKDSGVEERMFWFTARHLRSLRDEFAEAPLAMQQAGSLVTLGDRPLMVVTALQDAQEGWAALQDEVSKLSTNSSHWSLSTATHDSLIEHRADAALSSQAIREVVAAVRTSRPLVKH